MRAVTYELHVCVMCQDIRFPIEMRMADDVKCVHIYANKICPKPRTPSSTPQIPNPPIPNPRTPIPKPQTPNPKPQTPNPKPQTPNPKPQLYTADLSCSRWILSCNCTSSRPIHAHATRHTSHVTRHTSHVTRHTSHVTRHTSHDARHTSNNTHIQCNTCVYIANMSQLAG